jgi:hypothetical protein
MHSQVKHALFKLLTAASLLLFIATTTLWIRSCWVYDAYAWISSRAYGPYDFSVI